MASSTFSVFGADTRITGDVSASADLHIDGRVARCTLDDVEHGGRAALNANPGHEAETGDTDDGDRRIEEALGLETHSLNSCNAE